MELKYIVDKLRSGGIVLHRPETVWGLSCDARLETAVNQIGELKQRPPGLSYIVLVSDVAMMERYVETVPDVAYDLLDQAIVPISIIYPKGVNVAPNVCAEDGSIGIRVTTDPLSQKIIRQLRAPIVSTSANISGDPAPRRIQDVNSIISTAVDATIERQDELPEQKPSTIIKLELNGEFKFLRP